MSGNLDSSELFIEFCKKMFAENIASGRSAKFFPILQAFAHLKTEGIL